MSQKPVVLNFIEHLIEDDLNSGMSREDLRFRFPPEPNGYLHIGHTKAIGISFGLGEKYQAPVNLRLTIPIQQKKSKNMWMQSKKILLGWVTMGSRSIFLRLLSNVIRMGNWFH